MKNTQLYPERHTWRKRIVKILSVTVVFFMGCNPTINVSSDYDRSIDFHSYKTFLINNQTSAEPSGKFGEALIEKKQHVQTSIGSISELNSTRITNAIRSELNKRGLVEGNGNQDLTINVHTVIKEKHQLNANNNSYGYGAFGRGALTSTGNRNLKVIEYKDGTLVIDAIDSKTKKLVWTGTGQGEIMKAPKDPDEAVNKIVSKVMAQFPLLTNEIKTHSKR